MQDFFIDDKVVKLRYFGKMMKSLMQDLLVRKS